MANTARLRARPGAASVIAVVALVAALAGTALAGERQRPAPSSRSRR